MKKALSVWFVVLLFFIGSPAFAQESPLKTTLYFPHWTDGDGWSNKFQFTNLLWTHSGRATLRFYNNFGNEVGVETDKGITPLTFDLPKGGAITITTLGRSTGSTQGMAVVEANVRLAGKIEYHYPSFRIRTAVPPSPTRRAFTVFANYVKHPVLWRNTGIALANPQSESSYIDLALVDEGGAKVDQKRITLQPRSHIAELLDWVSFFPEYFATHEEFHGTIAIVAERQIAVLTLEFEGREDGTFLMDNASSLPPRYLDIAALNQHSIQAVYFVPKDIAPDPDYVKGIQFIAEEVLDWYDIELQRAGQDTTSLPDFVKGEERKVNVGLVNGQENLAIYADFSSLDGWFKMVAEARAVYPGQLLIVVQTDGIGFALGGGGIAQITASRSATFLEYSFRNFNEDFLRNGTDSTVSNFARLKIASNVKTAAHELGHVFGFSHSNSLGEYFSSGKYINLMRNGPLASDGDVNLGFLASSLMPDIPSFVSPFVNIALDREEIDTLIH